MTARERLSRGPRRILAALAVLIAAWLAVMTPVLMFPRVDVPEHADAVLVLGPPAQWRVERALAMAGDGVTDTVVISRAADQAVRVCDDPPAGVTVICFTPDPFTTQGEARALAALADERGWDDVAVITMTPHVARTRLVMQRCMPDDTVQVYGEKHLSSGEWAYNYVYQTGAYLKAFLVTTGC